MSTSLVMRNGVIAAMGISGLMLSACASHHGASYPGEIYAYESGPSNCGVVDTHVPAPVSTRYGSECYGPAPVAVPAEPVLPPVVYTDCGTNCGYPTGHSAPITTTTTGYGGGLTGPIEYGSTYTGGTSTYTGGTSTYTTGATVECPAGTTLQSDNTCLQGGSYSGNSYSSTTTSSYTPSTTTSYSSGSVECPAGTSLQSDNTCMQSGGSSYSSHSTTTTYVEPATTYIEPTTCSTGTVIQSNGSCMSSGYGSSTGYTATDYLPIRK